MDGMQMSPGAHLAATYDVPLVLLSVLIASVASYAALALGERVAQKTGAARWTWLAGGAIVMGCGIWSMHFTGMLAFRLSVPVSYDLTVVAASLVAAIVASGVALFIVSRPSMGLGAWLAGGLVMGTSIALMHYIGMAAMRVSATTRWDYRVVALSVAIAVVVSLVALALVFHLRAVTQRRFDWRRAVAAAIMGVAVAAMHYVGMSAASFSAAVFPAAGGAVVSAATLGGGGITLVTFLVLGLTLAGAYVDRKFAAQISEIEARQRGMVVAGAPLLLLAIDVAGTITMAEGRTLEQLKFSSSAIVNRAFADVFRDVPAWLLQVRRALAGDEFVAQATIQDLIIELRWTPVYDENGVLAGVNAVGTDVTERRRADDALRYRALYDELTNLPNRAFLNERLNETLLAARASGVPLGLALLDLNRFKEVNDTLGHSAGDTLLQLVAARVREVVREGDFVARLGGDEIAVLLPGADQQASEEVARRIGVAVAAPCSVDAHVIQIGCAIGIAVFPAHGLDATTLLRHADVAMYVAKRANLGHAFYDPAQDEHSSVNLTLENGLRHAISGNELVLHYQPKMTLSTGLVTKVEALVRWRHPTMGELAPDRFIGLAEATGLIVPLTQWVIENALRQVRTWERRGLTLGVAVNLSMRTLHDPALPELVESLLRRYAVAPAQLTLEITESALTANSQQTRTGIMRLAELGIVLSIDDFGTGYSSLRYLNELPVNEIKVDKSFVLAMADSDKDASIVRWVIQLGHELGMRVVAEGVESAQALETLAAAGCDSAQGFFLARPLPAAELEAWVTHSRWSPDATARLAAFAPRAGAA